MSIRRPVSWFLSEQGRKFSFALVTGTSITLTAVKFTPHTFFLQKYKDFVHYYSEGLPVRLPNELINKYQKCLDLLQISQTHRKLIEPFSVFGYDLFHAGSTSSKFGGLVGIPVNFTYKTLEDIERQNVEVNQKKLDLSSEAGRKLADAMILPDNVKEFAICREILMTQNNKVLFESTYPFISIFIVYNLSQFVNRKMNLYAGPSALRGLLYTITGLFGLGIYFLMKDMTEVYYETHVDKKLCDLGQDYIKSGVVFYEKLLQRNQALRELMGKEGENKYSVKGNENYGLRQPHISLVHRKQYFEHRLTHDADDLKEDMEDLNENKV